MENVAFSKRDTGFDRRNFLKFTASGMAAMALPRALSGASFAGNGTHPNFIIIMTDDQGWNDLGCFGSPDIKTPNVDRMCSEGMKFTDFYAGGSSICSPSRASLLTGCYAHRIGFDFGALYPGIKQGLHPNEITIAEQLKKAGYATGCVGKWHVGGPHAPFMPNSQGFDSFFGTVGGLGTYGIQELYHNLEIVEAKPDQAQYTHRYTQEAIQFITANQSSPFLLYLAYMAPHSPNTAHPDFAGTSARGIYGDVVEEVDWGVGEILKKLKTLGIDNNTCVVFLSDNGPIVQDGSGGSAYPWVGEKFSMKEGGTRVPCVMRWPAAIPAGSVCAQTASHTDFFVTFSTIAGVAVPDDRVIDGKNIYPLMTGVTGAVSPYDEAGFFYMDTNFKPIRKGKWKYQNVWGDDRLNDLTSPDHEKVNLAKSYPDIVAELKALAEAKWVEIAANTRPIGDITTLGVSPAPSGIRELSGFPTFSSDCYYTLQGRRIPASGMRALPAGIYLKRDTRGKFTKILIK